jgi:mRNA interferase MazF
VRRGELRWADLGPRAGRRPVVIVTRNEALPVLTSVVVVPVTRTIRGIDSEVPVGPEEGLPRDSVANCDSVLTVRRGRIDRDPIGALGDGKIRALDRALRFALEIR